MPAPAIVASPLASVQLHSRQDLILVLTGFGAGIINGVAGGGQLLTFPVLLALGYPAIQANISSTVGIWPGYAGGLAGYRSQIGEQRARVERLAPVAVAGGVSGGVLLLTTPPSLFATLAPWLVLAAAALFGVQPLLTRLLGDHRSTRISTIGLVLGTYLVSVYGGYFGAGLGILMLAVFSLTLPDSMAHLSGLRSVLSVLVNGVAALVFIVHGSIAWEAAGWLALGCLCGGFVGARLAIRLPEQVFRLLVVGLGLATGLRLLVG